MGTLIEVFWCSVARQALSPEASDSGVTTDALQAAPTVATALITMDVGMAGVSGLLMTECNIDKDCSPFGVTDKHSSRSIPVSYTHLTLPTNREV